MKRVLVLGGSGFLGSHVADALTEAGYAVRIFDRQGSPFLQKEQEMIVGDLLDLEAVAAAARGCSVVYNFAGMADINESRRKPIEALRTNILGNAHALEAARGAKVERYVLASTVYVYSASGSFYRVSKQACEQTVETFYEEFGLNYTILRYGSLYGRRADGRNGIFRLLSGALAQGRLRYNGTGEELREYIHVGDAARLSVEILKPEFANQNIILTGHHPMRVCDLMQMIQEILGGKVKIEYSREPMSGHYSVTPYTFHPKLGKKLVGTLYTDMGQGLLDCLSEIRSRQAPASPIAPPPRAGRRKARP